MASYRFDQQGERLGSIWNRNIQAIGLSLASESQFGNQHSNLVVNTHGKIPDSVMNWPGGFATFVVETNFYPSGEMSVYATGGPSKLYLTMRKNDFFDESGNTYEEKVKKVCSWIRARVLEER